MVIVKSEWVVVDVSRDIWLASEVNKVATIRNVAYKLCLCTCRAKHHARLQHPTHVSG